MTQDNATVFQEAYSIGPHNLHGINAQLASFIFSNDEIKNVVLGNIDTLVVARIMDPAVPHEERGTLAVKTAHELKNNSRLSRWLPLHNTLLDLEYQKEFHQAYRDHTIHTIQVYLLGWYLYYTVTSFRNILSPLLVEATKTASVSPIDNFREWWTLTALWHDQGYIFETDKFNADNSFRERILSDVSAQMGQCPFTCGINSLCNTSLNDEAIRKIYEAGRYYPWKLNSISHLLNSESSDVLNSMWSRLGMALEANVQPLTALHNLTRDVPPNRPPYFDHGTFGSILLSDWQLQLRKFLDHLTQVVDADPSTVGLEEDRLLEEYVWIDDMKGVYDLAVEAIGYHNINLEYWPQSSINAYMLDAPASPKLCDEPHLAFLCIVDYLQEWDRHHYRPYREGLYDASLLSSEMLIEGRPDCIKIAFGERDSCVQKTVGVLSGHVDQEDLLSLFESNPEYSLPDIVMNRQGPSVEVHNEIVMEKEYLLKGIGDAVIDAKRKMLFDDSAMLVPVLTSLNHVVQQVESSSLLAKDRYREIVGSTEYSALTALQKTLCAFISKGSQVTRGCVVGSLQPGGFGSVFMVEEPSGGRLAYKVFHPADLENWEKRRLFKRGYKAMKMLSDHPRVVRVHEFTEVPVGFYMDLIPGPDLSSGPIGSKMEAFQIGLVVAETIADAHQRGILHRDIKPANILLDSRSNNTPILTDFDLAWIPQRSADTQQVYATVRYGAPEQFELRLRSETKKCTVDVYSFGRLMFFLMMEEEPPAFAPLSEDHFDEMKRRMFGHFPPQVIDELVGLTRQCTSNAPSDRPSSMEKVVAVLRSASILLRTPHVPLTRERFENAVAASATDPSKISDSGFCSITGRTEWSLSWENSRLLVEGRLLFQPAREGGDFGSFRRAVRRKIDMAVNERRLKWAKLGFAESPQRMRAANDEGLMWIISIGKVELKCNVADEVAALISHLTRIIES